MAFAVSVNRNLGMESGTRKGRKALLSLDNSMSFFRLWRMEDERTESCEGRGAERGSHFQI